MDTPAVVMRPMELSPELVNHKLPSGPATIAIGTLMSVGTKFVTTGVEALAVEAIHGDN